MKKKIVASLTGIPETLWISACARYFETKRPDGLISDPKIVEIVDAIGFDLERDKKVSKGNQVGLAIHTQILDEQTQLFILENPDGILVNLGCGLDTRSCRLDNGKVIWYDLDVPEVIAVRKKFFQETDRLHFIAKSVLDFSWLSMIPRNKPILFIAEGLLMYFTKQQVRDIFTAIASDFSQAVLLVEGMSPFMVENAMWHADVKEYHATFKWGIKSGRDIEDWNIGWKFVEEWYCLDQHKERHPFPYNVLSLIPAVRKAMKIMLLKTVE